MSIINKFACKNFLEYQNFSTENPFIIILFLIHERDSAKREIASILKEIKLIYYSHNGITMNCHYTQI